MTAKEYLYQAFKLDQKINSKLEQVAALRELAGKATACIHAQRISGTVTRSPMENAVLRLIDLEHEINQDIDKLVDLKQEMSCLINKISNEGFKVLLELRYLSGNSWEDIAEMMGYELRWVYRLHGKALQEFELIKQKTLASHAEK